MAALKSFETQCPRCGKTAFAVSHPGPIHCPACGDVGLYVFVCERTKKGFPALWEKGGGYTNTGEAQVITGPHGEKLKPIYVKTRGPRACEQHALFVVQPNYHVIRVWYWNKQRPPYSVAVYQIQEITEFAENPDTDEKKLLAIAIRAPEKLELKEAVEAAMQKARCYHCRTPHYAILL